MTPAAPDPVREAISKWLAADSSLGELLSAPDAIFHRVAEGDAPYVVFNRQAGSSIHTFGGSTESALWLVKGISRSSAKVAESIDARCQELLDMARLTAGDGRTLTIFRQSAVDYGESGDGERWDHVGSLYRVYAT